MNSFIKFPLQLPAMEHVLAAATAKRRGIVRPRIVKPLIDTYVAQTASSDVKAMYDSPAGAGFAAVLARSFKIKAPEPLPCLRRRGHDATKSLYQDVTHEYSSKLRFLALYYDVSVTDLVCSALRWANDITDLTDAPEREEQSARCDHHGDPAGCDASCEPYAQKIVDALEAAKRDDGALTAGYDYDALCDKASASGEKE